MSFDPVSAGFQLFGGLFGAGASRRAAKEKRENQRRAIEATEFKPYAVTSGFGSSYFDPESQTAGFELDDRLANFRDQNYDYANQIFGNINTDPTAEMQKTMGFYKEAVDPMRQAQALKLGANMLSGGRVGVGVSPAALGATIPEGMTGSGLTMSPELLAMYSANAAQDKLAAMDAYSQARENIANDFKLGQDLFGFGTDIEKLATVPMDYSLKLQQVQTPLQQAQANVWMGDGGTNDRLNADMGIANMLGGAGSALSSMVTPQSSTPSSMWAVGSGGGNKLKGYVRGGW
jgi:hypothetical protein